MKLRQQAGDGKKTVFVLAVVVLSVLTILSTVASSSAATQVDAFRYQDMAELQRAARGEIKADLAIINCRLVDVLTYTTYPVEIYAHNGVVVHITIDPSKFVGEKANAKRIYDAKGAYVAPGFLDSHVHCESSMLTPYYFGRAILLQGTTSAFTDCHEIANVAGLNGMHFMLENSKHAQARQFIDIPSCVPSVVGLENSGASFTAKTIEEIVSWGDPRVVGLAEVMDYVNVIKGEARMSQILQAASKAGLYLQSHYYRLFGRELSAYLIMGLKGNHELRSVEEVVEVLRQGGCVDLKGASSITDFFSDLLKSLEQFPRPEVLRITLCTDDVHANDITNRGHVNLAIQRMIDAGFDPIFAIACATRNTAQEYDIGNLGNLAIGSLADMVVFDKLDVVKPRAVFVSGELVADEGKLLDKVNPELVYPSTELASSLLQTVKLNKITTADLAALIPDSKTPVSEINVNIVDFTARVTELVTEPVKVTNGHLDLSERPDLVFAVVFNRYGLDKRTLAVLKNYGLVDGAIATTVAHDSHNLIVIFRDPEAAVKLVNGVIECGGGIGGRLGDKQQIIDLAVGGIMSLHPAEKVIAQQIELQKLYQEIFKSESISILKPVTITLIVSPKYKLSDEGSGIVDVLNQQFVPLFPDFPGWVFHN